MKYLQLSNPNSNGTTKESRKLRQLKSVMTLLARSEQSLTIPEIAEHVSISVPTGTKLVNELVKEGLVIEEGKKETESGRKPALYALNKQQFYAVGAEVLSKWIHVSVVRIDLETVHHELSRQFVLDDTKECLDYIISFIKDTIKKSPANEDQIIGIGMALTGSVNGHTGESALYFKNMDLSLKQYLEGQLKLPVMIDNDTRAIGIAEQTLGRAKGVDNVLIVKVSRRLGLSIILDRKMILGSMGYAGNFGHTQFSHGHRLCNCGKKGCLVTEVGGDALRKDLEEALQEGESSLHFQLENIDTYKYHDILDAVLKGDALSLRLLQTQGDKLGQALGNVVNLLNPERIVIGGEFVMVKNFFIDAIKMGIKKTALVSPLGNCRIKSSNLGRYLSSKAGACMLLKAFDMIDY